MKYHVMTEEMISSTTTPSLAFYTCYFGGRQNYSRHIPPLPSTKYPCFYFTNDRDISQQLEHTGWQNVFCDNIPIHNDAVLDTMETKELRCCPHRFPILQPYTYLCWLDSKIQVYEDQVEALVEQLQADPNKVLVLCKHPYSKPEGNSVWDEYHLAMEYEKYATQSQQNVAYLKQHLANGFSERIDHRFCGTWRITKQGYTAQRFGDEWLAHIRECGINDQISLSFVLQHYQPNILATEYQAAWKYFYQ